MTTSIQKAIKKTDPSPQKLTTTSLASTQLTTPPAKDLLFLRKQLINHLYFTQSCMEQTLQKKFKAFKRSRRIHNDPPFQQTPHYMMSSMLMAQSMPLISNTLNFHNSFQQQHQYQQQQQIQQLQMPLHQHQPIIFNTFDQASLQQINQVPMNNFTQKASSSEGMNNYMMLNTVQQNIQESQSAKKNPPTVIDACSDEDYYENFKYIYSYFSERQKDITIEHHDLKKLAPNQYLNDTIVNFFLKFLEIEMIPQEIKEKVLIFNTYFMSKLAPNDQIDQLPSSEFEVMAPVFEKNYNTVRRWIKEDIFEKEILVFPLNLPEHWSVIIVRNHKNVLNGIVRPKKPKTDTSTIEIEEEEDDDEEEVDSKNQEKEVENGEIKKKEKTNTGDAIQIEEEDKSSQNPTLLYFDSFGLLDKKYANIIRMYLNKEYETKKKAEINKPITFDEDTLPAQQPLIPRQTNYVDCGLYLLEYVENFLGGSQEMRDIFTSDDSKKWIQLRWFPRCNILQKRRHIKELLIDLSKLEKAKAIENYTAKRLALYEEKKDSESEYDEVSMGDFEDHIEEIVEYDEDYPNSPDERHRMLLDFYMNPSYNQYETV